MISETFDANPKHLCEFCEGVEAAKQVVHPAKDRLLARKERNTWEQIRANLEENYAIKGTLEYYAGMLFTTKQGVNETVAQWGSRIDNMGIDLIREAGARIEKLNPRAVEGRAIWFLKFMKGSFIAGLRDDRTKYVVKAKEEESSLAQLI